MNIKVDILGSEYPGRIVEFGYTQDETLPDDINMLVDITIVVSTPMTPIQVRWLERRLLG